MKFLRWALIVVLIFALMAVRFFQTELFYDPLLAYFKTDYHHVAFPEIDLGKHLFSMLLRYGLNTLISLGIIAFIFNKKPMCNSVRWCMWWVPWCFLACIIIV